MPHPSATVVVLRDAPDGLELLLLRRNPELAFHGGAWVFPGGRIDAGDRVAGADVQAAARAAAVRETREEAGLEIATSELVPISCWTTPEGMPRRFVTWFFAAAGNGEVRVDGGEIHGSRWLTPAAALAAQRAGELELPPATFVTITTLSAFQSVGRALGALASRPAPSFFPRFQRVPGGACSLYEGDAGYPDGDFSREGARHRLWMLESGWQYERSSDPGLEHTDSGRERRG